MPTSLIDIVAGYAVHDFSPALQDFMLDETGQVLHNDHNTDLTRAITEALVSRECDPAIKRQICINGKKNRAVREQLINITSEIRRQGNYLNLDNTDLSRCDLSRFDLSDMTACGAIFKHTNLKLTGLDRANLRLATFTYTSLDYATMGLADLSGAKLHGVSLIATDMRGVNATGAVFLNAFFFATVVTKMMCNDPSLNHLMDYCKKQQGLIQSLFGQDIALDGVFTTSFGLDFQRAIYETRCYGLLHDIGDK